VFTAFRRQLNVVGTRRREWGVLEEAYVLLCPNNVELEYI